jgi:glucose/arabinose dehydrogenase
MALNLLMNYKSNPMLKSTIISIIFLSIIVSQTNSQPILTLSSTGVSGLAAPVDVVAANDGTNRIFIVQQGGIIKVYDNNFTLLNNNFLTLSGDFTSGGERGLLSVAFHPDYENNRYFFVYYTNGAGGVNIDRFETSSTNPNQAVAATRTNIITVSKPVVYANHNGGKLNFGADGNLYAGIGDSGSGGDPGNLAQNGNSLWGKMIRINVDNLPTSAPFYNIPANNPFVEDPNVRDEIFSLGLRNPWRWSFDKITGNIWIADVGQNAKEEVNSLTLAQASGANYGWRCYEGLSGYNIEGCLPQNNYISPIFDYPHNNTNGGFSITGGIVYRGTQYPAMYGYYMCADYVSGNVWLINSINNAVTFQPSVLASISCFGELENGEMVALTLGGGLFRVTTSSVVPLKLLHWNGYVSENINQLQWQTADENNVKQFEVEYSTDAISFLQAGIIAAKNLNASAYTFQHKFTNNQLYYRLKTVQLNGQIEYSKIILLKNNFIKSEQYIFTYNSNPKMIWLNIPTNEKAGFQLYNINGQNILNIATYKNNQVIDLQKLPTGIYVGKIIMQDRIVSEKILIK